MKSWFLPLLLIATLFVACDRNAVKVVNFEPQGEVQALQSFSIEFDKDLAPLELQDQWLDDEFVEFSPAIPGRFKWLNGHSLIFSPDQALMPSQDYTAKIDRKRVLFSHKGSLKSATYNFHTPHFSAVNSDLYWEQVPHADHRLRVVANLHFNYEVDPVKLMTHLEVSHEGKPRADFVVQTEGPAKVIAVSLGEVQQTDQEQAFTVKLKKGLTPVFDRNALVNDREFSMTLPPIQQLAILGVSAGFNGQQSWIEISTTQEVDKDKVSQFVEIEPAVRGLTYTVQENRVRIEGNIKAGNEVTLKVKKGLPGLYGGTLENEYTQRVAIADLEPSLGFADRGMYLLKGGEQNLNLEAVNVEKAEVTVHEVFKNNLLFFFYNNYQYNNNYHNSRYNNYGSEYYVNYYGKQLYSKTLEFEPAKNSKQLQTINLDDVLGQRFKGIYIVTANSHQDYWRRDARLVAISDIGLIAKYADDELLVFANSLKTAEPMAGVKVKLISTNNQQLFEGTTDIGGVVKFNNIRDEMDGFHPALVMAEIGDDFNFLDVRSAYVETSRFDVGGKSLGPDGYQCFLYGDRNLYRPGEKVHLSGILRDRNMGTVKGLPVVLKVVTPRGKELNSFQQELNAEGAFEVTVDLPAFAETGSYRAELMTGDDQYLRSLNFSVEEFVPDKMRVMLDPDQEVVDMGKNFSMGIDAQYFFGAPAANHKYECDIRLRHANFHSKTYSDFNFSNISGQNSPLDNVFLQGELDEQGKGNVNMTVPGDIKSTGYLKGTARVSVFDATGRTVNEYADFKAYPNNYFLGIKAKGYYYHGLNQDINFDLVAVNPKDEAIGNFQAEVTLVRHEWRTVLSRANNGGRYRYMSERHAIEEWKKEVTLGAKPTPFSLKVDKSGRYELRVSRKGSGTYVSQRFYAYYYGRSTASSFEIDKEGRVEIILDKEKYAPGEKARVLFVTPFTGKMLVTVERDRILDHRYIDVTENSTEIMLDLGREHLPNAYISATLFRPHNTDNNSPFLVGHGYAPVIVEDASKQLPVEIQAPAGPVKPRTEQTITIKTLPEQNIQVTLAVVDEGILQIKDFKTPDPFADMYAKRRLQVSSYDLYEYLLPEIAASKVASSAAGGDERSARLSPNDAKRFKLLAKWSGIRRTDAKGEVKVTLDIPQFNGEVRMMAVAYQADRFGSAELPLKIADDIILQPSVPRFLSVRDSVVIPVTVMNSTEKSGKVTVKLDLEGPLKNNARQEQSVNLGPKGTGQVVFAVEASNAVGKGKMRFTTTGMDKVEEEIEIGVRPISPLVVDSDGGTIKAGETRTVRIPKDYIKGTQHSGITITDFPAQDFSRHLRYLVGYPHGCVEQTTSKLFPQLYFSELAAQIAPERFVDGNPVYYVKQGILKLQGMIRYDGAFTYWPGGREVNWWGAAYATHFLLEAKKKGYQVNENLLEKALDYLAKSVAGRQTFQYASYKGGGRRTRTIARKEIIYSLYVMALAGEPDISLMNYYRANTHLLSGDCRYLLAGAFAQAKNWRAFNELLPKSFEAETTDRQMGYTFDSNVRANALMLNVLLDVDPNNSQISMIARYLSKNSAYIWNTQDRAWTFLALGKLAKRSVSTKASVEIQVGGKTVHTITNNSGSYFSDDLNGQEVTLKATGTGELFYYWNTEGIKVNGVTKEEDVGLQARRYYYDRFGNQLNSNRFRQGDLIVCQLSLKGGPQRVENVAISDLIPSGFEIENPRLTPSADLSWIESRKNRYTPDYLDVRDDRLLLFLNIGAFQQRDYYYLLRVVNTGTFELPALGAEAMYDPDYRSYHGGGRVVVGN